MEDDGFDGAEGGSSIEELARESRTRGAEHRNTGYREGISAGQNATVQEGFNQGVKEAVLISYAWGQARGAAVAFGALPQHVAAKLVPAEPARSRISEIASTTGSIDSQHAARSLLLDLVQPQPQSGESTSGALIHASERGPAGPSPGEGSGSTQEPKRRPLLHHQGGGVSALGELSIGLDAAPGGGNAVRILPAAGSGGNAERRLSSAVRQMTEVSQVGALYRPPGEEQVLMLRSIESLWALLHPAGISERSILAREAPLE